LRILITGGAGCLGSNLIEHYHPKGHEICVIDNFATGNREVVPEVSGLQVVEGSVSDFDLVKKVFRSFLPTHVIHSAASYKNPQDWLEDCKTNILGTIHVANVAKEFEVKRFINFQTALCYGRPKKLPIPIVHPTSPFTSYGISKTAGEAYLMQSDLPIVSLRLANICGPRLSIGPIPTFYQRLKANKDCFCSDTVRDFLDISDFFSLMDLVLQKDMPTGVFNVSTGIGSSVLEVFQAVANFLEIKTPDVPIVPVGEDDVQSVVLDPSLTTKLFGWKAKIDFKTTIKRQLEWYQEFGVSAIYSHLKPPK
jgi:UDP-glucose 4-epimerase